MTGTNLLHVPYKSSPQAMTDLIGGRLQFSFDNMSFTQPHVEAGRVRAIGVSSPKLHSRNAGIANDCGSRRRGF